MPTRKDDVSQVIANNLNEKFFWQMKHNQQVIDGVVIPFNGKNPVRGEATSRFTEEPIEATN